MNAVGRRTYSGLIGRFVLDILQIPGGCGPASKTSAIKLLHIWK